jgi:putative peptidoglycan lipid II flippase
VYAVGLLGHALVGVLSRAYYTGERRTWYPALAMGIGLVVTAVVAAGALPFLHAYAIAAGNGVGITTTAVLLLTGLRDRIAAVSLRTVGSAAARLGAAAVVTGLLGWFAQRLMTGWPAPLVGVAGGVLVLVAFAGLAHLAGVDEIGALASQLKRRIRHGQ